MPVVRTDDAAKRLRYIYLGPSNWRLPVDVRFPSLGMFLVLCIFGWLLSFSLTPTFRLALVFCVGATIIAGLVTKKVMKHVDHDRPIRYWLAVIRSELSTPRPPADQRSHRR